MATTKRGHLVQHGDDLALVLDAETVERMKINADTSLQIVVDDASLIVTVRDEEHRAALHALMEEMNEQYGEAFKRLAE
ncbi:MAG: AbrB/MazE/SpoVT family DNA-binding domain-containing protein [Chloroflexota bacterium]|nr:AbrB/MazE/SpoVT family DNA-binding domain-containing protein [Chloroflexota bacterium]